MRTTSWMSTRPHASDAKKEKSSTPGLNTTANTEQDEPRAPQPVSTPSATAKPITASADTRSDIDR